jgi:hypothetical protein
LMSGYSVARRRSNQVKVLTRGYRVARRKLNHVTVANKRVQCSQKEVESRNSS